MPDDNDQVQGSESAESGGGETENPTSDNQETQGQEQSKQNEGEEETFDLPDGRKVDAKTLSSEWKDKFYPEFTRRSQELAELRKQDQERKARVEADARQVVSENQILKQTPPEVREAIIQIVKPMVDESILRRDQADQERKKEEQFQTEIQALEKEYPGGNGLPKFNTQEVIKAMQEPGNTNFNLKSKFFELHEEEFKDYWVKDALKKQQGGSDTERTGQGEARQPSKKTPRTFQEASNAFLSRLKQS